MILHRFFALYRRSCDDPGEILATKILQMPCLRGACVKALVGSWVVLVSTCAGPFFTTL